MSLSAFDRLSADILSFLESYIKNRGNLKEMERESGASYQLLRSQLNVLIGEWGFEGGAEDEDEPERLADKRLQTLARLGRGEREPQAAVAVLQKLQ